MHFTAVAVLGIGALRWSDLDGKQRSVEFAARCGTAPTQADLAAFLRTLDGQPVDPNLLINTSR
jgi:hypothetical protein